MRLIRLTLIAAALLPATATAAPPSAAPTFDPLVFFAGQTEGRGRLKIDLSAGQPVTVHGRGRVERDGTLVLDQTVIEGDKPATERRWTFTRIAAGRYAGTLSDAAGPVAGEVVGSRLHLHFHMKGGIVADQRLDLTADGRSALNRMSFRKLGVVVARLDETIRREP